MSNLHHINTLINRPKDELLMILFALGGVTLFATEVIINPYSRYLGTFPGLTGSFYRSLLLTAILITIWIYKYGWYHATILSYSYYGLFYLIFNIMFFLSYGQNPLTGFLLSGYSNVSFTLRGIIMLSSIAIILYYKLYHISYSTVISGLVYISYSLFMIYIFPLSWMSGEGNIPLQPLPQLIEFGSIVLSVNFVYHLLRWKQ